MGREDKTDHTGHSCARSGTASGEGSKKELGMWGSLALCWVSLDYMNFLPLSLLS